MKFPKPLTFSWLIGLSIGMALLPLYAGDSLSMMGGMMGGHGNMMQGMMGGMLPPGIDPADLPEPRSAGARLLKRYCAQCHNLPAPGMHTAEEWPPVVSRMNRRMQMMSGGMMGGGMMRGMMGIEAPTEAELRILIGYLQKHAQKPLDPEDYKDLDLSAGAGKFFRVTCAQCHALPDPKQHTAQEWPAVVDRMKRNMVAMGKPVPNETTIEEIVAFLQQHGRE
jgi:mono/diheme cytochrome c family protein